MNQITNEFSNVPIARDRDVFLRDLVGELSTVLESSVGEEQAAGFIAVVGHRMGAMMNREYQAAAGVEKLDPKMVAAALVDLKARIKGGFSVVSIDPEKIVLKNSRCPFGDAVRGHKSLCMMTSNVFGRIAADNLGYARVSLEKTIAAGDSGCLVTVHLTEGGPKDARTYLSQM